jgi:hypothetical protein
MLTTLPLVPSNRGSQPLNGQTTLADRHRIETHKSYVEVGGLKGTAEDSRPFLCPKNDKSPGAETGASSSSLADSVT